MTDYGSRPAWMQDELVQNIPKEKLELLSSLFAEADARRQSSGGAKSQKEMLMLMMPVLKKAKESNLSFTPKELQSAIAAIRKHSSPEELQQIDKIYNQHINQS